MTKIILADNQAIFRTGAAKVLSLEDGFRIVAQCDEGRRLVTAVEGIRQCIVLVATSLQLDMGEIATQLANAGSRGVAIVDNNEAGNGFLQQGYHGVIRRNITGPALVTCVRHVSRGERYSQAAIAPVEEADSVGARVRDRLTPKEMRIVGLIVQGCKNKEIAGILSTTEQVIKNYLRSIYDKTGVSDRLELALFTIHHRTLAEAAAKAGAVLQHAS